MIIISQQINLTSKKGNILSSDYTLSIDSDEISLNIVSNNILKEEQEYKAIKTKDVIALNAEDSGFQSLKAIILGIFLFIVTIQLLGFFEEFNTIVQVTFTLAVLAIVYGIQRSYEIDIGYQSMSQTLPIAISGKLEFEGNGMLPMDPVELAAKLFKVGSQEIAKVTTKDGFINIFSYQKTLTVTENSLILAQEKSQFTPSTYFIVPLKNIIAINVTPTSFRSLKIGIIGIFLFFIGVSLIVTESLFSGIFIAIFGTAMILYGFARIMKTTFTYAITGKNVETFVVDGEIVHSTHDVEQLGEIIMNAVINNQPNKVEFEEGPAK